MGVWWAGWVLLNAAQKPFLCVSPRPSLMLGFLLQWRREDCELARLLIEQFLHYCSSVWMGTPGNEEIPFLGSVVAWSGC